MYALDDLGLLVGGAGILHAGGDAREEGVGLLAVAFEVGELGAAVTGEGGEEALELGGGLVCCMYVCMCVCMKGGWMDGCIYGIEGRSIPSTGGDHRAERRQHRRGRRRGRERRSSW